MNLELYTYKYDCFVLIFCKIPGPIFVQTRISITQISLWFNLDLNISRKQRKWKRYTNALKCFIQSDIRPKMFHSVRYNERRHNEHVFRFMNSIQICLISFHLYITHVLVHYVESWKETLLNISMPVQGTKNWILRVNKSILISFQIFTICAKFFFSKVV